MRWQSVSTARYSTGSSWSSTTPFCLKRMPTRFTATTWLAFWTFLDLKISATWTGLAFFKTYFFKLKMLLITVLSSLAVSNSFASIMPTSTFSSISTSTSSSTNKRSTSAKDFIGWISSLSTTQAVCNSTSLNQTDYSASSMISASKNLLFKSLI